MVMGRAYERHGPKSIPRVRKPRQRLIELRKAIGSQRHVSNLLGVSEIQLRKVELGQGDPSVLMVFVFAEFFGVSVYDLFPEFLDDARQYLSVM